MKIYNIFYLLASSLMFACESQLGDEIIVENDEKQEVESDTVQRSLYYPEIPPADSTTVDWEYDSTYILTYVQSDIESKKTYDGPTSLGQIDKSNLTEISGIVAGINNPHVLWTHNDSGGMPIVYALDKLTGGYLGLVSATGASNKDWEDIAAGPGPEEGKNYLYLGDIGDNSSARSFLKVYRIEEPVVGISSFENISATATYIIYDYPEGPRDAEAMLVDPISKDIIIITKREMNVHVYCLPFEQLSQEKITATLLGKLPFREVVAADISNDGQHMLVKTYGAVYHWTRFGNEHLKYTFSRLPEKLPYNLEVQGESIAWSHEDQGYYTLSESDGPLPCLYYYTSNE